MQTNSELYNGELDIDSRKPTALFLNYPPVDKEIHIRTADNIIKKFLSEQFNVVSFNISGKPGKNIFVANSEFFDSLKRKDQDADNVSTNRKTLFASLDRVFKQFPHIDYAFLNMEYTFLPQTSYVSRKDDADLYVRQNEFFDYTEEIPLEKKKIIDRTNAELCKNFYAHVSNYAFSTKWHSITFFLHEYLSITGKVKKFFLSAVDPVAYRPKLQQYGNTDLLYFANDRRGSRNMRGFDLAQINNCVNVKIEENPESFKKKDFVWIGSLFYTKGQRSHMYEQYFENLEIDFSFYCPLHLNSFSVKKKTSDKVLLKTEKYFKELLEKVKNDPHYMGRCEYEDVNKVLLEHKYSLITHCASFSDSLNFRPVSYAMNGVLPLLEAGFDPGCLIYPREIQDKLIVSSSNDIEDRIDYFNKHDNERKELLLKIRSLLKIDDYMRDPIGSAKKAIHGIIPEYSLGTAL